MSIENESKKLACICKFCKNIFFSEKRKNICHVCLNPAKVKNLRILNVKNTNYSDLTENNEIIYNSIKYNKSIKCGIYFLIDRGHNIIYIGQSKDIDMRLRKHYKSIKDFIYWSWIPVPSDKLLIVERQYIAKYKPILNKSL